MKIELWHLAYFLFPNTLKKFSKYAAPPPRGGDHPTQNVFYVQNRRGVVKVAFPIDTAYFLFLNTLKNFQSLLLPPPGGGPPNSTFFLCLT